MTDSRFDDAQILALLQDRVRSVEELGVLIFMTKNRHRTWAAFAMAEILQLALSDVSAALVSLGASGLVQALTDGRATVYRYAPAVPALAAGVENLLTLYEEAPQRVLKVMSQMALARARTEASGFFTNPPRSKRNDGSGR